MIAWLFLIGLASMSASALGLAMITRRSRFARLAARADEIGDPAL